MKNILIDGLGIDNKKTGVSQYSVELLKELLPLLANYDVTILVKKDLGHLHEFYSIAGKYNNVVVKRENIPAIGILREIKYLFVKMHNQYDLFHCLSSNMPVCMAKGNIVTIHDLKYIIYPHYLGRFYNIKKTFMNNIFKNAVKKCSGIITVSNSTKSDLFDSYGKFITNIEKVKTIYEASTIIKKESRDIIMKYDLLSDYFVYIGELRPHKNVDYLIKGFNRFTEKYDVNNVRLIIGGKKHKSFICKESDNSKIVFTGYVDDNDLFTYYKNSIAYVLLSKYEGFGLPILEAMDAGTAVITSNVSSMPEIAGSAALIVDPADIEAIADSFHKLYSDKNIRNSFIKKGLKRVSDFSWKTAAMETKKIYEEIICGK